MYMYLLLNRLGIAHVLLDNNCKECCTYTVKVAISEFELSMLMLILLIYYMLNEVMRYLHASMWFGRQ